MINMQVNVYVSLKTSSKLPITLHLLSQMIQNASVCDFLLSDMQNWVSLRSHIICTFVAMFLLLVSWIKKYQGL